MYTEVKPLLESLKGQSYKQIRELLKKRDTDYSTMINWWTLIPHHCRKAIRKRLYTFLMWKEGHFRSRRKFMKLWQQKSPATQEKILLHWYRKRRANHKVLALIVEFIRSGVISKRIFHYIMEPLTKEQLQRIQLYWWAKLECCHSHPKVVKVVGNEPCLEFKLHPNGPLQCF